MCNCVRRNFSSAQLHETNDRFPISLRKKSTFTVRAFQGAWRQSPSLPQWSIRPSELWSCSNYKENHRQLTNLSALIVCNLLIVVSFVWIITQSESIPQMCTSSPHDVFIEIIETCSVHHSMLINDMHTTLRLCWHPSHTLNICFHNK